MRTSKQEKGCRGPSVQPGCYYAAVEARFIAWTSRGNHYGGKGRLRRSAACPVALVSRCEQRAHHARHVEFAQVLVLLARAQVHHGDACGVHHR